MKSQIQELLDKFNKIKAESLGYFSTRPDVTFADLNLGAEKLYTFGDSDDYGRQITTRHYVKANSPEHACIIAAVKDTNLEYYFTAYYNTKVLGNTEYAGLVKGAELQLAKLTNIL